MRKAGLAVLAAAAAVVFAVAGCGGGGATTSSSTTSSDAGATTTGGSGSGSLKEVNVGVLPSVSVAPLYLGAKQGFFADEGLKVVPHVAQGGAAMIPAIQSGQWQFGFSNVLSLLIAREKGLKLQGATSGVTAAADQKHASSCMVVAKDSSIHSLKDMAGKTVAVNTLQNIDTLSIKEMFKKAGLSASDVKLTEVPFPEMITAVDKGQVDAAALIEPFTDQAVSEGNRIIGCRYLAVAPRLTVGLYITSEKVIQDDPDMVDGFRKAMNRSLTYANTHHPAVRKILPTYTKLSPEAAHTVKLNTWVPEVNMSSIKRVGELGVEQGLLNKAPSLTDLMYQGGS